MRKATLRLSLIWCLGVFLFHIGITAILGMMMFVSAMGSFTHGPGMTYYAATRVMWVWNPLVMLMIERHLHAVPSPEIIAALWSLVIGLFAGLIRGSVSKPDPK